MADLPLAFYQLGLPATEYFMSDDHSFRGPCIQCGGTRRMVTFLNGAFPKWWMRCDLCGMEGWLWEFFDVSCLVDGEVEAPSLEALVDNLNAQTERAARFEMDKEWETYYANLNEDARAWWRAMGVPNDWQDFWEVGYKSEHTFLHHGELYKRPAYSMPKRDLDARVVNLDYRLVDPPLGVGKYRPYWGLPARSFIARYDLPNLTEDGRVIIVEGSKKAMVTSIALGGAQVIGLPGCKSWRRDLLPMLQSSRYSQAVVVLDPDATRPGWELTKALGHGAINLAIPVKIDDAFIHGWLTADKFWSLVKNSGRRA